MFITEVKELYKNGEFWVTPKKEGVIPYGRYAKEDLQLLKKSLMEALNHLEKIEK